jgi:hypothetical protein
MVVKTYILVLILFCVDLFHKIMRKPIDYYPELHETPDDENEEGIIYDEY